MANADQSHNASDEINQVEHLARAHKAVDAELIEDIQHSQMLAKSSKDIDERYFRSPLFIGTLVSLSLTVVSSYFGFAVPASVITLINADIGQRTIFVFLRSQHL